MNPNELTPGKEYSQGPINNICCLQDNGVKCQQQAGNASYSKRIRKIVEQLNLHLDAVTKQIYICDYHKNMIQSARSTKSSSQDKTPVVDFSKLQLNVLKRYKKHFKIPTKPSLNKAELAEVLLDHFKTIPVNEKEVLTYFIHKIKTNGNRLDQKTTNNKSDTI